MSVQGFFLNYCLPTARVDVFAILAERGYLYVTVLALYLGSGRWMISLSAKEERNEFVMWGAAGDLEMGISSCSRVGTYAADWSICWIPVGDLPTYYQPSYLMTSSECDFVFVRLEIEPMS